MYVLTYICISLLHVRCVWRYSINYIYIWLYEFIIYIYTHSSCLHSIYIMHERFLLFPFRAANGEVSRSWSACGLMWCFMCMKCMCKDSYAAALWCACVAVSCHLWSSLQGVSSGRWNSALCAGHVRSATGPPWLDGPPSDVLVVGFAGIRLPAVAHAYDQVVPMHLLPWDQHIGSWVQRGQHGWLGLHGHGWHGWHGWSGRHGRSAWWLPAREHLPTTATGDTSCPWQGTGHVESFVLFDSGLGCDGIVRRARLAFSEFICLKLDIHTNSVCTEVIVHTLYIYTHY